MTVIAVVLLAWFLALCALGAWWVSTLMVDAVLAAVRRRRAWRRARRHQLTVAQARVLRFAARRRSRR